MTTRRVLDSEEVVQDSPSIAVAVPRFASPDEEDDDAAGLARPFRRLHGEGESPAAPQVKPADDRP